MRADPRDQQQPPEHDERPDLGPVLGGEPAGPAVALEPAVHQRRHLGLVLEEAHRGAQVVQVPAEPGVVEVDDADRAVVDEQVGQPGVGVHQAVALRARCRTPAAASRVSSRRASTWRSDGPTPMPSCQRPQRAWRPNAAVVVPVEPGEPVRPAPPPGVPVHPRGDLAELGEMAAGQLALGLRPGSVPGRNSKRTQCRRRGRRRARPPLPPAARRGRPAPAACAPRPRRAARPSRPARRRSPARCGSRAGARAAPKARPRGRTPGRWRSPRR